MAWKIYGDRRERTPDLKRPWPTTLGDARSLISATFVKNRWDDRDRRFYLNSKGIRPKEIDELDRDDCRTILEAMQKSRMIIFETPAAPPIEARAAA
jgi:hypothetical protein